MSDQLNPQTTCLVRGFQQLFIIVAASHRFDKKPHRASPIRFPSPEILPILLKFRESLRNLGDPRSKFLRTARTFVSTLALTQFAANFRWHRSPPDNLITTVSLISVSSWSLATWMGAATRVKSASVSVKMRNERKREEKRRFAYRTSITNVDASRVESYFEKPGDEVSSSTCSVHQK